MLVDLAFGDSGSAVLLPERPKEEHDFLARSVLLIQTVYFFTAGPKRSTSSFHDSMILAFVLRAV
jgi:hypothetical protein